VVLNNKQFGIFIFHFTNNIAASLLFLCLPCVVQGPIAPFTNTNGFATSAVFRRTIFGDTCQWDLTTLGFAYFRWSDRNLKGRRIF